MEGNARAFPTELSHVLVHLLTKASCVNKKVSSNSFILQGTTWSKVKLGFYFTTELKDPNSFYFLLPVRPCDSGPCKNGGNCSDDGIKCFKCECRSGFKGPDCSEIGKTQA